MAAKNSLIRYGVVGLGHIAQVAVLPAFKNAKKNSVLAALVTGDKTDFWRETHYGFIHDSGHLYGFEAADGFTAQVRVRAQFEQLYDQAGIMVTADWLSSWIDGVLPPV